MKYNLINCIENDVFFMKQLSQSQLEKKYNAQLKKIEKNYLELLHNIKEGHDSKGKPVDIDGLEGRDKIIRRFSAKVMNPLIKMEIDFQALEGKDLHQLPVFVKQEDLVAIIQKVPTFFASFAKKEAWMYRFANGDVNTEQWQPNSVFEKFKAGLSGMSAQEILGLIATFEKGVQNPQSRELQRCMVVVNERLNAVKDYQKEHEEDDINSLQKGRSSVLQGILFRLEKINANVINAENDRFMILATEKYATKGEQNEAIMQHMDKFKKNLSLQPKIDFLNSVLHSRQNLEGQEERYAVLFEHHKNPKGLWKSTHNIDTSAIQKLTALRDALQAAEAVRVRDMAPPMKEILEEEKEIQNVKVTTTSVEMVDAKKEEDPPQTDNLRNTSSPVVPSRSTTGSEAGKAKKTVRQMVRDYERKLEELGFFSKTETQAKKAQKEMINMPSKNGPKSS